MLRSKDGGGRVPPNRSKTPPPPPPTPALVNIEDTPSFKESLRVEGTLACAWSKSLHVMIPGTLVYSPLFVRPLVSLALLGGRESTASEISASFNSPPPTDHDAFQSFYQTLQDVAEYFKKFHSEASNCHFVERRSLWIKRGFEIKDDFIQAFDSALSALSFQTSDFYDANFAAQSINSWFSKETSQHIQNVASSCELNEFIRILLLQGIYFCGNWKVPFPVKNTKMADFRITSKRSVKVSMMNRSGKFLYAEFPALDAEAVAIPYHGDLLYLVLILPKSGTNLDKLRMRGLPFPILKGMKERSLNVLIPRFTLQTRLHLIPLLQHIGIKAMFDPTIADFSGITGYIPGGSGLFVSDVIQVVKVEVNEGSSVANPAPAPAQAGQKHKSKPSRDEPSRAPSSAKRFTVDHPFILQVVDSRTGTLLLDGTCIDPSI